MGYPFFTHRTCVMTLALECIMGLLDTFCFLDILTSICWEDFIVGSEAGEYAQS